jgi:hypothetical protein
MTNRAASLLLFASATLSGCESSIDGGSADPVLQDAVWCDVEAPPCVTIVNSGDGLPPWCSVVSDSPLPASAPGGDRVCFDSTKMSAQAACAALCDESNPSRPSSVAFPRLGSSCAARVDSDPVAHAGLNAEGFRPHACTGLRNPYGETFSGAGTNTVTLTGKATATYGASSTPVAIRSGRLTVSAPRTDCTAIQSECATQVDQLEISFDDFALPALQATGLTLFLDGPFPTTSGQRDQPPPPLDPEFIFAVPPGIGFSAIGAIDANGRSLGGFGMVSDTETLAALDLTTGAISLQFSLRHTLDGQVFALSGTATTQTVVDVAPTIAPLPAATVDAGPSCITDVTLTASVSSPVGLPVTVTYAIDDGSPAIPGPTASGTLYVLGPHQITIFASDSLGATATATQTITVDGQPSCP